MNSLFQLLCFQESKVVTSLPLTQQALTQRSNKPAAKVLKAHGVILVGKGPWRSLGLISTVILSMDQH